MDTKRRNFITSLGMKTAALAAGAATPTALHLQSIGNDLKSFSKDLNVKIGALSTELKSQVQSLHNRLDGTAINLRYQQLQLYLIFLLLLMSFAIDAGMTAAMLV